VRQGEASRGAFLVRAGEAEARVALPGGGSLAVARFGPGDIFGEMALIERGVCSATVVARTNVDGWFVGRDDLRALVASRDTAALAVQREITKALADKLQAMNDRIRDYAVPEERAAREAPPATDPLARAARSPKGSFEWRAFLPLLAFFEGFDAEETDELASLGRVIELERGAWIFAAGLPATAAFLVVRGAVELFSLRDGMERRIAIAGPGALVGYVALLRGAPHGGNARAREACCLLELPRERFLEAYAGDGGMAVSLRHAIHRILMRSLARTNNQLARLVTHARLEDPSKRVTELEAALQGQVVRPGQAA
jgi:CRP-like cAMP-binding protein